MDKDRSNPEVVATAIRDWHERVLELDSQLSALRSLLHMAPEAPLSDAAWRLVDTSIAALDAAWAVGGWLEWWCLECQLGEKPLQAGLGDEPLRDIKTIDDLIAIVLDDLAQSDQESKQT